VKLGEQRGGRATEKKKRKCVGEKGNLAAPEEGRSPIIVGNGNGEKTGPKSKIGAKLYIFIQTETEK